jgi:hypothetical protein
MADVADDLPVWLRPPVSLDGHGGGVSLTRLPPELKGLVLATADLPTLLGWIGASQSVVKIPRPVYVPRKISDQHTRDLAHAEHAAFRDRGMRWLRAVDDARTLLQLVSLGAVASGSSASGQRHRHHRLLFEAADRYTPPAGMVWLPTGTRQLGTLVMGVAGAHGHVEAAEWLLQEGNVVELTGASSGPMATFHQCAAFCGQHHAMYWAETRIAFAGVPYGLSMCQAAASNRVQTMHFLAERFLCDKPDTERSRRHMGRLCTAALPHAARSGHAPAIHWLLAQSPGATVAHVGLAMWAAAEAGQIQAMALLSGPLAACATHRDHQEWLCACLEVAAAEGQLAAVGWLYHHGSGDARGKLGKALVAAATFASTPIHVEIIRYLLDRGADAVDDIITAAQWAAREGHVEAVDLLVSQRRPGVDDRYIIIYWALRTATVRGQTCVMRRIFEIGADDHSRMAGIQAARRAYTVIRDRDEPDHEDRWVLALRGLAWLVLYQQVSVTTDPEDSTCGLLIDQAVEGLRAQDAAGKTQQE